MEMKEIIEMMQSDDHKERFKAEYYQFKDRYEKLKALNTKIEAANNTMCGYDPKCDQVKIKKVEMPKYDCPEFLLREQQSVMGNYLHILEVRAVIEGIVL